MNNRSAADARLRCHLFRLWPDFGVLILETFRLRMFRMMDLIMTQSLTAGHLPSANTAMGSIHINALMETWIYFYDIYPY